METVFYSATAPERPIAALTHPLPGLLFSFIVAIAFERGLHGNAWKPPPYIPAPAFGDVAPTVHDRWRRCSRGEVPWVMVQ